jgi:starch-binding outer membrane protein, SusD/RagB family
MKTRYTRILFLPAHKISLSLLCLSLMFVRCEDFVQIDPPRTDLVKQTVFADDATAKAAMLDIYYQLQLRGFASGGELTSISFLGSYASDEQLNYVPGSTRTAVALQQFNTNALVADNHLVLDLWTQLYKCIFRCNSVIEGVSSSSALTPDLKMQLQGEAKFIRAFCYFYLVNLWGDVPLILSTDYRTNARMPRTPTAEVYDQIIIDLLAAKELLPENYSFSNKERVRANKGAATALLARTYLYVGDWTNSSAQASELISNTAMYRLTTNLPEVFRANGPEAIWQLWSTTTPQDRSTFFVSSTGPNYGALRQPFLSGFEPGDQRLPIWTRNRVVGGTTYYFAFKYGSFGTTPPLDYTTVLRLAEQYLIRAEAEAHLNNIAVAQADINTLRQRAGLPNTTASTTEEIVIAIENERKAEFFTEWGHRWFDLKRYNRADAVLAPLKTQWSTTAVLFPIPQYEILNNAGLTGAQNNGY